MKKIIIIMGGLFLQSCFNLGDEEQYSKGFQVSEIIQNEEGNQIVGLPIDSLTFELRPQNVLATHYPRYKVTPIFKVNYNKKGKSFTGNISYHLGDYYDDSYEECIDSKGNYMKVRKQNPKNVWNHFMPGFSAIYGYNMVNISLYDTETQKQKDFFNKPVLIRTFYFPSEKQDILNYKSVTRSFYMVSVYDEDTNQDGYINTNDLRRFYSFDLDGNTPKALVPKAYSVVSSQYDSQNDLMYVFTRYDANQNGKIDSKEPYVIFWIDLNNFENKGILYQK